MFMAISETGQIGRLSMKSILLKMNRFIDVSDQNLLIHWHIPAILLGP